MAELPQITVSQLAPSLWSLAIRLQQFRLPQAIGTGAGCEAQPAAGFEVKGDHRLSTRRWQPLTLERTAHQAPATAAATRGGGKLLSQLVGARQGAQPVQAAETATIEHQVHRQLQFIDQPSQPLQGEQISTAVLRVAALAEPIQLTLLTRP